MPNFDEKTGIRYGVISPHSVSSWAMDDIYSEGTDPYLKEAENNLLEDIKALCDNHGLNFGRVDTGSFVDELIDHYENPDGAMDYSDKDYDLHVSGDNFGIFVMRSPYYTYCRNCSPCAPGAGDLDSPTEKDPEYPLIGITLCLGKDWFDEDHPCPYRVYRVDNDQEVI